MADEQRRLVRARRELTELLVLKAALRGRLHVLRAPRGAGDRDVTPDAYAYATAIAHRRLAAYRSAMPTSPAAGATPEVAQ